MRQALTLHPDSTCAAATGIEVEVARPNPGSLVLHYCVTGRTSDLRLPAVVAPARVDELWRRTCFEAFVQAEADASYYEFNFSPSLQWAAYRFSGYRDGMSTPGEIGAPRIDVRSNGESYALQAELDLDRLPGLPGEAAWRLGLCAVIEEAGGGLSHWALAHPPGKPDFHHGDCFACELEAA